MHGHPRAAGRHAQGYRRTWSSPRLGLAALFQRGAVAGALTGIHDPKRRLGVMSIARQGGAFESGHRELFRYLVGQASISVENGDLHEPVSEQAITDELIGLSNQRRFRELIEKEASRAERFGHELSVMILGIDDVKQVNDAYGHLQGGRGAQDDREILLDESRGVDEPARYGGVKWGRRATCAR